MQIFVQAPIPGSSSLEFNQDRDDPQHLAPATEGARSMRAFGMLDESCPNSTQYWPHCSRAGRESTMPPSATLPLSHQRQLNCGQGTTCCPQRECVEDVKNDSSFRGAEGYCRQVTMKSRRDDTPMHNNPNAQQSQCTTIPMHNNPNANTIPTTWRSKNSKGKNGGRSLLDTIRPFCRRKAKDRGFHMAKGAEILSHTIE